jgi:hypothetical protein
MDKSKLIESLAEGMPYLVRLLHENGDKIFMAGSHGEMEKQILVLLSQAFTLGIGWQDSKNEEDLRKN